MSKSIRTGRFFYVDSRLPEAADKLNHIGLMELTGSSLEWRTNDNPKLLIDSKLRHFWQLNESPFKTAQSIIKNRHNDIIHQIDFNQISEICK